MPAEGLERCEFAEEIPTSRPSPETGPTTVRVGLFLFDLVAIDNVRQEFTVDFYLDVEWTDQRLGGAIADMDMSRCEVPLDDIWHPSTTALNARSLEPILNQVAFINADGTVEIEQRALGTFSARLDLTEFPLDRQTLTVTFISLRDGPEELTFVPAWGGTTDDFTEVGWFAELGEMRSGRYDFEFVRHTEEAEGGALTRFDFDVLVARDVRYYVWNVFLPLSLIVFTSWVVFWIDPSQLGVQSGVGTAMLLTIVAFMFSLQTILPTVPYLTRLDFFVYSALIFVFLALLESVTSCTTAGRGRERLALRMDHWSRAVFPMAFTGVTAWFWWG